MNKRDYYEILGVSKNASDDEIKSAFRKLAKKYHPDVSQEKDAESKFKEAQEAYAVLSDSKRRSQYDQFGHAAFEQNMGGSGGFSNFDFGDIDLGDIFGDLFGGSFGFGGRGRNTSRARSGADNLMRMKISFEEACFGAKKSIKLDVYENCEDCHGKGGHDEKTCPDCHGSGSVTSEQRTIFGSFMTKTTCSKCKGKGKTFETSCSKCRGTGKIKENKEVTFTIPAGVDTGNQLRISGKGEPGINGGPSGDLYIEFVVEKHPIWLRDDKDIYLELPITITEAVLGVKRDIPTIHGKVALNIPAGSQNGDKLRLKGKGVESINSNRLGDMYVILKVIIPEKLSKEQRKLIEELNKTTLNDSFEFKNINKFL